MIGRALRRRRQPAPAATSNHIGASSRVRTDAVVDAYLRGLADGVELALDNLDPRKTEIVEAGGADAYNGPVPRELEEWIIYVRANLDQERAARP